MQPLKPGKLVRDNIVDIIEKETGKRPPHVVMTREQKGWALRRKACEEAEELRKAPFAEMEEEIGDILDTLDEMVQHFNLSQARIEEIRAAKTAKKGAFRVGDYLFD
jgi:predicted house-cleaning noncanonical NTP pyrophosphatase (MazG superfamily)